MITTIVTNKPRPGLLHEPHDPETSAGETSACDPGDVYTDAHRNAAGNGGEGVDAQQRSVSVRWNTAT